VNQGFFIAQKLPDGTPGKPVGNDDGAIMMFEEFDKAVTVRQELQREHGPLSIFRVNLVFAGEVLI
jgi:hypothetical protein